MRTYVRRLTQSSSIVIQQNKNMRSRTLPWYARSVEDPTTDASYPLAVCTYTGTHNIRGERSSSTANGNTGVEVVLDGRRYAMNELRASYGNNTPVVAKADSANDAKDARSAIVMLVQMVGGGQLDTPAPLVDLVNIASTPDMIATRTNESTFDVDVNVDGEMWHASITVTDVFEGEGTAVMGGTASWTNYAHADCMLVVAPNFEMNVCTASLFDNAHPSPCTFDGQAWSVVTDVDIPVARVWEPSPGISTPVSATYVPWRPPRPIVTFTSGVVPVQPSGDSRPVLVDGKKVILRNQFPRTPIQTSDTVASWLEATPLPTNTENVVLNAEDVRLLADVVRHDTVLTHDGGYQWSLARKSTGEPFGTLTSLQSGFKMLATTGNYETFVGDVTPSIVCYADADLRATAVISLPSPIVF